MGLFTCGDAGDGLQGGQEVEGVDLDEVAEENVNGQHARGHQVAQAQLGQVALQQQHSASSSQAATKNYTEICNRKSTVQDKYNTRRLGITIPACIITGCPSPATGTAQGHFTFTTGGGLTSIPVCAVQSCASMAGKRAC